jgi:hypothetical protein
VYEGIMGIDNSRGSRTSYIPLVVCYPGNSCRLEVNAQLVTVITHTWRGEGGGGVGGGGGGAAAAAVSPCTIDMPTCLEEIR